MKKIFRKKFLPRKNGFSVVEMIIYFAVLALFSIVIVEGLVRFGASYRKLHVAEIITDSATVSLDRIGREIRQANNIDLTGSVFGVSPGQLKLSTTDVNGYVQTVSFALENGVVNVYENGTLAGPLTSTQASTTKLLFRKMTAGASKGVKVEMTLSAGSGTDARTENFYLSEELRDSI